MHHFCLISKSFYRKTMEKAMCVSVCVWFSITARQSSTEKKASSNWICNSTLKILRPIFPSNISTFTEVNDRNFLNPFHILKFFFFFFIRPIGLICLLNREYVTPSESIDLKREYFSSSFLSLSSDFCTYRHTFAYFGRYT